MDTIEQLTMLGVSCSTINRMMLVIKNDVEAQELIVRALLTTDVNEQRRLIEDLRAFVELELLYVR